MTNRETKIYSEAWADQFNLKDYCEVKFEQGKTHDELLIMEGENSLWMVECNFEYYDQGEENERAEFVKSYSCKVELYNNETKIKTYEKRNQY